MTPDVLRKIVQKKFLEVSALKLKTSQSAIEKKLSSAEPVRYFKQRLVEKASQQQPAVIAEVKRASPSQGIIRENFDPVEIAKSYTRAGATCLSVLTDVSFFQGADAYLIDARRATHLPVLRKDFIVDEYQIYEARAINADCVLLIVSILTDKQLIEFHSLAKSLLLDVLVEVHDADELRRALKINPDILGINNRNLRSFEVNLDTTLTLMADVPESTLLVTESGIHTKIDVDMMRENGVYSYLVGESFMREPDPGAKLSEIFSIGN